MVIRPVITGRMSYGRTASPPVSIYGPHHNVLANELGVTVKVLKTRQNLHERTAA